MSAQYPSFNDREFDLLKKLVNNTAEITGGGGGGAVSSVNGQTGAVSLDAADVGAAPEFPVYSASRTVYVDKGGNDGTGDGTPSNPYLTIGAAMAVIADASAAKVYNIQVGPGSYTGDIALKPFIFITGAGIVKTTDTDRSITYIDGTVGLAAGWGAANTFGGLQDLAILAITGGIGGNTVPVSCSTASLILKDVRSDSTAINWRDANSKLFVSDSQLVGQLVVRSGQTYLLDTQALAAITILSNGFATSISIYGGSTTALDFESISGAVTARVVSCDCTADATLNAADGGTFSFDAISYPKGAVTLQNGAVIARLSSATSLSMATARLLGRTTASTGAVEEITVGSGLAFAGGVLSASGSGDVVGPATSTDNAIARFDLATGKLIQNSVVRIDDLGNTIIPSTATDGLKIFESAAEVTSANFGQMVWIGNEWNIMTDRTAPSGAVRGMSITAYGSSHNDRSTMNINEKSTAAAPAFAIYVGTGGAGVTSAKPDGHFIFYDASSTQQTQSSGYSEMVKISSKLTQTGSAGFISLGLHRTITSVGSGEQGFLAGYNAIDNTAEVFVVKDGLYRSTFASASTTSHQQLVRKSRGTLASPTAVTTGDDLFTVSAAGYVGGTGLFVEAANIVFDSTGTVTNNSTGLGGIIRFNTRAVGGSLTEAVRIQGGATPQLLANSGTAANPAYSFASATGAGLYSDGTNAILGADANTTLKIAASGGSSVLTFNAMDPFGRASSLLFLDTGQGVDLTATNNLSNSAPTWLWRSQWHDGAITSGDEFVRFDFAGYVGATGDYVTAARIVSDSVGTITDSTTGLGAAIRFLTKKNGDATLVEALSVQGGSTPQTRMSGIAAVGAAVSSTTCLNLSASTTGVSSIRLAHGAAPSSPVNGDMWTTTAGLFVRINGATVGPLS